MRTSQRIACASVPVVLLAVTSVFVLGTAAAIRTAVTAAPGDTETVGTFIIIGLMTAVCAWGTGVIAKVSIDDVRKLA